MRGISSFTYAWEHFPLKTNNHAQDTCNFKSYAIPRTNTRSYYHTIPYPVQWSVVHWVGCVSVVSSDHRDDDGDRTAQHLQQLPSSVL
eukprot:1825837-Pleurochrysis_carterae.AAC.1